MGHSFKGFAGDCGGIDIVTILGSIHFWAGVFAALTVYGGWCESRAYAARRGRDT